MVVGQMILWQYFAAAVVMLTDVVNLLSMSLHAHMTHVKHHALSGWLLPQSHADHDVTWTCQLQHHDAINGINIDAIL